MALTHGRLKKGSSLGPYKIVRLIGEGGMGEVYEARDEILARQVALKVVLPELSEATEVIRRFTSEGQTLARLNHQNVVTVHTLGEDKGTHYIVMEYVDGVSLWDLLQVKKTLEINEALHYFKQLLSGIKALHEHKVIHRDIKPKNIIIRKDNSVKIVDFGIAKIKGQPEREITATGAIVGSVYYLAPEVLDGQAASIQSDIWSLGINLYEVLMGFRPFQDDNRLNLIEKITTQKISFTKDKGKVPEAMQRIIQHMCEKQASQRYASVSEILRDLEAFKSGAMLRAPQQNPSRPSSAHPQNQKEKTATTTGFQRPVVAKAKKTSSFSQVAIWTVTGALLLAGAIYKQKFQSQPSMASPEVFQVQYPQAEKVIWLHQQQAIPIQWSGIAEEDVFLEIARDLSFQIKIAEIPSPRSPYEFQMPNGQPPEEGKYFWRLMRAGEPPLISSSFVVVTEDSPRLTYPPSHLSFSDSKPINFYWQEKAGVKDYRFQIGEDLGFRKLVRDQLLSHQKVAVENLTEGLYYWRVRVEEASGQSQWSEARSFFVKPPVRPVIASAPVVKKAIQRKPQPVARRGSQKRTRKKPLSVVKKSTTVKNRKTVSKPKVARKVAVVPAPAKLQLEIPKLKLPPNGVSIVSMDGIQNPISFKWEEVQGIEYYRLEVSAAANFTEILHSEVIKGNQAAVVKTWPSGRLYWRLRSEKGGDKSDWSSVYTFEISK